MDLKFKICFFLLCLTFAESRDCTLREFVNGNLFAPGFDTSDLQLSYSDGDQVKVECALGFNGFFRMNCNNGIWETRSQKCEARLCGHPGEADFADFNLVEKKDFVFGAKVVYTCHKGYQMISRRNFRRCTDQGWDGNVPTCEPLYCPILTVNDGVRVVGSMEEATSGNVIQFYCNSRSHALLGPSEISCDENGQWVGDGWTGSAPTCDAIQCPPPEIENGYITDDVKIYHNNQVLNYKCNLGYQPQNTMPSVCSLQGRRAAWSVTPSCQPVKCYLGLSKSSGTSFDTAKTVFSPGEEVTVQCADNYFISNPRIMSAKTSCQENGKWSLEPQCQEVYCINPHDKLVQNSWVFRESMKMGQTVTYSCKKGYKRADDVTFAKCTRDGWTPKPLCIDSTQCSDPKIPNGFFHRPPKQDTVYYACNEDYKLSVKSWWNSAQCKSGAWSTIHRCIENTVCGDPPEIPHGKATPSNSHYGQRLQVTCDEGYSAHIQEIQCQNGDWLIDEPSLDTICRPIPGLCDPPPRVENAVVLVPYKSKFLSGSTVTYQCHPDYMNEGDATIMCENGTWEAKTIKCIKKTKACELENPGPLLTMSGHREGTNEQVPGTTLHFQCNDGIELHGTTTIHCLDSGMWSSPFPTCTGNCKITGVESGVQYTPGSKTEVAKGETLTFSCENTAARIKGMATVECLENGVWSHPFPSCGPLTGCGTPPQVSNGETVDSIKKTYTENDKVKYECQLLHILEGDPYKTCSDGEWIGEMRCLKPCTVTRTIMDKHNIDFKHRNQEKMYAEHNDGIGFRCKSGTPFGTVAMRQTCNDGHMELPTCRE